MINFSTQNIKTKTPLRRTRVLPFSKFAQCWLLNHWPLTDELTRMVLGYNSHLLHILVPRDGLLRPCVAQGIITSQKFVFGNRAAVRSWE
ncbi:hypothetical protein PM082_015213 [Marasmius tenuissimus]|nr:hypothetical protein PM082_015213 [Marasmius tenuissimus]